MFPFWAWLPAGLLLVNKLRRKSPESKRRRLTRWTIAAAWLVATIQFSEEWISLTRTANFNAPKREGTIRVVTLNCAAGDLDAVREIKAHNPDIVFLQESPKADEVAALAKELFGDRGQSITGPDAAVITNQALIEFGQPKGTSNFVAGKVGKINLVSLRLQPPAFRVDLFIPDAWSEVAKNRVGRREELAEIAAFVKTLKGPTIVAGDFNTQSGDASLKAMPDNMRDAFYEAGSGWCHTAVNDYPLARIDQIWISKELQAKQLKAFKTVHSDHRMVVADLVLIDGDDL